MVYRDPPRFSLRRISRPELEPIELEQAMEHLGIPLDDRHMDAWLNRNIPAARMYCEGYLGRALAPQTLEISFGGNSPSTSVPTYWQPLSLNPWVDEGNFIELPMGPVTSIESVSYYDSDDDLQTMSEDDYVLDGDTLTLATGASWPTVYARRNAIQIRYVAGYTLPEDSPSDYPLPWDLRSAMLLVLGHFYENREAIVVSQNTAIEIPMGAKALMDPHRLRLGMA